MIGLRTVGHGFADLRAHPWRAGLSGISLCIGVLAVVAIFTLAAITAEVFIATEEQRNGRLVTASGEISIGELGPDQLRDMLAAADPVTATGGGVAIIAQPATLTGVARPHDLAVGHPLTSQLMTLVAGDLTRVKRLPMLAGRWFDGLADLPVELVVNVPAARQWGGVGTDLMVSISNRYPPVATVVSGVVADGQGEAIIYVSLPALLHVQPYALDLLTAELLLHHPGTGVETLTQVGERVAVDGHGSLPGPLRRADTVGLLLEQLRAQQAAFLVVALVALAIAALGMLNIGLASVGERTRELVIRRAVGATRVDILGQMLVSSIVVGVAAAAVAVAAAWIGVQWWVPQRIAPSTAIAPPGLPWAAVSWGLVAAISTTVAGSLLPAVVAARLDVATALRD
jgi:putative ABC transport system permease protein